MHFSRFRQEDIPPLRDYLQLLTRHRSCLSFKAMAVERATIRRHINETVRRLHEFMVIEGARHEIENNRFNLPREIELTIDHADSLDQFALRDIA